MEFPFGNSDSCKNIAFFFVFQIVVDYRQKIKRFLDREPGRAPTFAFIFTSTLHHEQVCWYLFQTGTATNREGERGNRAAFRIRLRSIFPRQSSDLLKSRPPIRKASARPSDDADPIPADRNDRESAEIFEQVREGSADR